MATAPLIPEPLGEPLLELDDVHPNDDQATVARRIKGLMGENGVSQQRLASAVGISRVGLSDRLAGKTNFTLRELYRIARAFRVPVRDLFPPEAGAFSPGLILADLTERGPCTPQYATGDAVQGVLFEGYDRNAGVTQYQRRSTDGEREDAAHVAKEAA